MKTPISDFEVMNGESLYGEERKQIYIRCVNCEGKGQVHFRHGFMVNCIPCGGTGLIPNVNALSQSPVSTEPLPTFDIGELAVINQTGND
jgi:hypothetical protein